MKIINVVIVAVLCLSLRTASGNPSNYYHSIFNLGDSLSDTGNFLLSGALPYPQIRGLPYGETFFHFPTGRFADGRLIIDFIETAAVAYGLPYLPPYLSLNGKKPEKGVNFAVAGATALDAKFFYDRGWSRFMLTNDSLSVQLEWFKKVKSTLCSNKQDCAKYFEKTLFLVGEIGGNDYNFPFMVGATLQELKPLVPLIIQSIVTSAAIIIEEGAVEVVVPGNLPIGCNAFYLTLFRTNDTTAYDQYGCLKAYNEFSRYHNSHLKLALEVLRQKYPHAKISYADYYGAAETFFHDLHRYGFSKTGLVACCGGGGPYNVNNAIRCGDPGSNVCLDPTASTNWDGFHMTEAAYHVIARGLLQGTFMHPPLSHPPQNPF